MHPRALLPLLMLGLPACGGAVVEGIVLSPHGQPVVGAPVTVDGQPCADETDERGAFQLTCEPGELRLHVRPPGQTEAHHTLAALEHQDYSAGLLTVMPTPPTPGLWLVDGPGLRALPRHTLRRTVDEGADGALSRRFCLEKGGDPPLPSSPGPVAFAERLPDGAPATASSTWRAFKLDAEGCAYRDTRNARLQWTEGWKVKPVAEVAQVAEGHRWVTLQLEAGDWFIADWNDFFVPLGEGADNDRFGGAWIQTAAPARTVAALPGAPQP